MSAPDDDRPKNTGPRRGPVADWGEHEHVDDYVDPAILREVEAELGLDPIEKAPPPLPTPPTTPPVDETARQAWRQVRRGLLAVVLLAIAVIGWRVTASQREPAPGTGADRRVPLPPINQPPDPEVRAQSRALSDARRRLASSDFSGGINDLENLANENADTRYGADAMLLLAATYRYQKNEPERAVHWYRRFLDQHPRHADAPATTVRLAEYLVELGRESEARDALDAFLRSDPGESPYHRQAQTMLDRLNRSAVKK
ncbi:MAG: hypothetical protein H6684_15640 [Deltaproteobacteria bacterium]|nr:hypothetical protein [Deltaproteobacteria bacterium]MCB9490163.1 hypothetical protein [Deltaproteobacteria bacterium]